MPLKHMNHSIVVQVIPQRVSTLQGIITTCFPPQSVPLKHMNHRIVVQVIPQRVSTLRPHISPTVSATQTGRIT